jgi:hypothetical protein
LPLTVAEPAGDPPLVHVVGAEVCGPKTVKVIVPVGLAPPARVPDTELVAIAVPAVPVPGPLAVRVGEAAETTVSDIPVPQVVTAVLLLASPP